MKNWVKIALLLFLPLLLSGCHKQNTESQNEPQTNDSTKINRKNYASSNATKSTNGFKAHEVPARSNQSGDTHRDSIIVAQRQNPANYLPDVRTAITGSGLRAKLNTTGFSLQPAQPTTITAVKKALKNNDKAGFVTNRLAPYIIKASQAANGTSVTLYSSNNQKERLLTAKSGQITYNRF
ncbi:hypothetical protein [Loigolactobacillus backii]|uniref:hypothetical protein n=1 Tax=Loigolactobacillus backii TaxID=375175 RepID=UPI000C1CA4BE|nr:hypothetical protein [Loigolactobacillus backii]MDA5388667.1 hypothetical protein [Loigolactobacillus backii]MDA5391149.1 hypothetical protein [Loigolactobacillus backii]PIO82641.1 hypothetical protein BSQ39_03175 [Loigolactobacillus backii]